MLATGLVSVILPEGQKEWLQAHLTELDPDITERNKKKRTKEQITNASQLSSLIPFKRRVAFNDPWKKSAQNEEWLLSCPDNVRNKNQKSDFVGFIVSLKQTAEQTRQPR